jgi:hypothetical protein
MIVEEKPTMTRAVEAGIAVAVILAAWMYTAAATEIQNPYFHPPQTSAPTPDGTPPDVHPGHCHINRFYCSLLASPLDSDSINSMA